MTLKEQSTVDARQLAARILVVDPNGPLNIVLVTALARAGHQAFSVHTASEARAVLGTLEHGVDLVIIELDLPDGRGRDLVSEVIRDHQQIRAILMTSKGSPDDALLAKPFSMATLVTAVNHALGRLTVDVDEREA